MTSNNTLDSREISMLSKSPATELNPRPHKVLNWANALGKSTKYSSLEDLLVFEFTVLLCLTD